MRHVWLIALCGCSTAPAGTYVPPLFSLDAVDRLVFLGDSITEGSLPEQEGFFGYAELLVDNDEVLWPGAPTLTEVFGEVEQHNLARAGAQSTDLVDVQLVDLHTTEGRMTLDGGTLVFVTIGGNDIDEHGAALGMGVDVADSVGAELTMLAEHLADPLHFPDGGWLFVGNLFDPTGPGDAAGDCYGSFTATFMDEELSAYNTRLRQWGEDGGFAVIDLYDLFREHGYGDTDPTLADPTDPNPPHWFSSCSQPNARGHHEMRQLFFDVVVARVATEG